MKRINPAKFPNLRVFFPLFKSEHTARAHSQPPHPHPLRSWALGSKASRSFSVFPGRVFKSQQQTMREKEECSPRNPACSTCSPSAEGSTSISCRDSPLCCSREGKLWQDFKSCLHGKAPAGKDREHRVLLQRNR